MENDGLTVVVASHDKELETMRAELKMQSDLIESLSEACTALAAAVEHLPRMARHIERINRLTERHDRTLRAMHKGLHETSDPR